MFLLYGAKAHSGHFILAEVSKVTSHHAVERDILSGIIQHPQQLQSLPDLLCGKIACSGIDIGGNAFLFKDRAQLLVPAGGRTQQDDDILISGRAHKAAVLIPHRQDAYQFFDPMSHCQRLLLPVGSLFLLLRLSVSIGPAVFGALPVCPGFLSRCILVFLFFFLFIHQKQLRLILSFLSLGIIGALFERNRKIVVNAAYLLAHNALEGTVHAFEHFLAAAEILV